MSCTECTNTYVFVGAVAVELVTSRNILAPSWTAAAVRVRGGVPDGAMIADAPV